MHVLCYHVKRDTEVCFQRLYSKRRAWNATAEYTRAGSEEPIRPPF